MPVWEVVRQEDAEYPVPGFEGDVLGGGPLTEDTYVCTAGFEQPRDNWLKIHGAHDYAPRRAGRRDFTVRAQRAGRLEWFNRWNGISGPGGGYGNVLLLRHADGEATLYAHLQAFVPRIEQWLAGGGLAEEAPWFDESDVLGLMGNTGNVWPTPQTADDLESGKHLHLEVRTRAELGSILIDPAERIMVVHAWPAPEPELEAPLEPNPTPNEPVDLTFTRALDEARLFFRIVQDLKAHPALGDAEADPYTFALSVIEAEADELRDVVSDEGVRNELTALGGIAEFYRTYPAEYAVVLDHVSRELTEVLLRLQALVPGSAAA